MSTSVTSGDSTDSLSTSPLIEGLSSSQLSLEYLMINLASDYDSLLYTTCKPTA